jgi:hypothetical protein
LKNAVSIVRQTIDDIASDLRGALFCLSPVLVVTGLWYCLLAAIWFFKFNANRITDYLGKDVSELSFLACMAMASMILFMAASWSAVAWHRKIIGSEMSNGMLPVWNGRRIVGYLGRSFGTFVVAANVWVFLALPLIDLTMDVLPVLAFTKGEIPSQDFEAAVTKSDMFNIYLKMFMIVLVFSIFYGYLLCESLVLPARAMDNLLRVADVRRLTKGYFLRLFVPLGFLMLFLLNSFYLAVKMILPDDVPSFSYTFLFLVLGIVLTHLLGFGILSRLYLRFVPQAPLVQH